MNKDGKRRMGVSAKLLAVVAGTAVILFTVSAVMQFGLTRKLLSSQYDLFATSIDKEKGEQETLLRNAVQRKGESVTTLLAGFGSSLVISYDFGGLEELAQTTAQDADVAYVIFYDTDNKPITEDVSAEAGQAVEVIEKPMVIEGNQVGVARLAVRFDSVDSAMTDVADRSAQVTQQASAQQSEAGRRVAMQTVVVSAGTVLLLCLIVYAIASRIVVRPIGQVVAGLKDIAEGEGDLTKKLAVSTRDEVGELSHWFNTFLEKLRRVVGDTSVKATRLAESVSELSDTATEIARGAESASREAASATSTVDAMSSRMDGVAKSSEQMSESVGRVAAAVEEMTTSINEVAKNAEEAAQVADEAARLSEASNENINTLGSAADEIGKVIGVIQDIAEQTNLLALNATIEAARAGEAGKGFAVVATEVKELAKQTAEATEDIRNRVEGIQSSTIASVESIGEIKTAIGGVNEISRTIASAVERQSTTGESIASDVAQTAQAAETVACDVLQSASESKQISKNIAGLDETSKQGAEGAIRAQRASEHLSQLADELRTVVSQFKV